MLFLPYFDMQKCLPFRSTLYPLHALHVVLVMFDINLFLNIGAGSLDFITSYLCLLVFRLYT